MNFIIVIRCVEGETYEAIRADMTEQMVARGIKQVDMPLFAGLETSCHDAETEIEVIWISEELERENFKDVLEQNRFNKFVGISPKFPEDNKLCLVKGVCHDGVALGEYDSSIWRWKVTPFLGSHFECDAPAITEWKYVEQ